MKKLICTLAILLPAVLLFSQNLNVFRQTPPGNAWVSWGSDADQLLVEEFVAAIREEREPAITGEDGLKALEIVLAAYESAETGQPVKLN